MGIGLFADLAHSFLLTRQQLGHLGHVLKDQKSIYHFFDFLPSFQLSNFLDFRLFLFLAAFTLINNFSYSLFVNFMCSSIILSKALHLSILFLLAYSVTHVQHIEFKFSHRTLTNLIVLFMIVNT